MPINTEFDLEGGGTEVIGFSPEPKDLFGVDQNNAALNLNVSFDRQPEVEAEILELSEKTRWPVEVVRARKKEALEQARKEDFRSIDEAALLGFIGKSPENAALVKDDIRSLRKATGYLDRIQRYGSKLFEDIGESYQSGDINLQLAPLYNRKYIQQENNPELDEQIKALEATIPQRTTRKDFLGEVATITAEQVPLVLSAVGAGASRVQGALPVIGATSLVAGLATGGTGAIPFAIGSAKGVFALGVAEEIAGLEAPMAAKEFSEFRDEEGNPLDPDVLKYAALTVGYVNAGVELVTDVATIGLLKRTPGFKKLLSLGPRKAVEEGLKTKTFRNALKRISLSVAGTSLINGLEEAVQELVTILGGEVAKEVSSEEFKDINATKAVKRVLEAGRVGTLGGLGFGMGTGSISLGTAAIRKGILVKQAKDVEKRPQDFYNEQTGLTERLDETKTKQRSANKTKELLEDGGLSNEGLVDGAEAREFYQTGSNSEIFTKLGITEEDVNKAAASGKSIPVKLSEIQSTLTLEESKKLFQIVRESADSLSLNESETINVEEELTRIDEALQTIEKERAEFLAEKNRIETEAKDVAKIRKIPQAETYAKGVAEILGNFSIRMSIEGDQSPATTLKRIRTEVSTFKDLADAEKFLKENGLENTIPLGMTQIMPEGFIMKLFEGANHSTLLHETGHVFLGEVESIVSNGHASEALLKDYDSVKEWLGVVPEEGITIEQQDKFAQAFELYLREGKAPTKGLTPFFERFKHWLTTVYRKVRGSAIDADLTDEIRGVFDRLLMVEEQTKQFVEENEFFISDAVLDSLGLTEEERIDFRRRLAGASKTANQVVQRDLAREHKSNIKQWTIEAEAEVAGKRVNNLYADLTSSKRGFSLASSAEFLTAKELNELAAKKPDIFNDEGMDPRIVAERFGYGSVRAMFKSLAEPLPPQENEGAFNQAKGLRDFLGKLVLGLNQKELEFQLGKQTVVKLKAKNARLVRKDGQNPFTVALEYGYESVDDMTKDLERRPPRKDQVQEVVLQKEREHYLNFTANDFFLNEKNKGLEKSLETLGDFLRSKAGIETDFSAKDYKDEVNRSFAVLPVRRASRTDWHLSDMRRALRNRDKSIKKGDFQEALKFHEQARLNYEFARRSNRIRKAQIDLRELVKKSGQSKGKIEFDYWKNIMSLGNKYGLRKGKEPQKTISFQNLLDAQASLLDSSVKFRPWIENDSPKNFRDLLVNQFEELKVLFEVLNHIGRKLSADETVLADVKHAELKQDLLAQTNQLKNQPDWDSESAFGKLSSFSKQLFSRLDTLHSILIQLDGFQELGPKGKAGIWTRTIFEKLAQADSEYLRINSEITARMKPALDQLNKSFLKYPKVIAEITVPIPENLGARGKQWRFERVLSIALNMGNRQNIEAAKEGYGLTESNLNNILSILTKEDWSAVQTIWDVIGSYRDPMFAVKKRISGFEPTIVEPDKFVTPQGQELKGGYYPLKRDLSLISEEMSLDMNLGFRDTETAAVADGPTQERVGFGKRPVKLDLSVLSQHVNFLSLYISHAETIKDISRIFADREISEAIVRKLGQPALESLRDSLRNISRSKYEDLAVEDRFFQKIRGLSTVYILGLRVSTSLKQYFSIFGFISRYGMKAYTPGVNETIKALRNREFNTLKQDVYRMSSFMRNRSDNLDLSINEAVQKAFLEKPMPFAFGVKPSQVRDSMFAFIRGMDFATTLPAWIGAFEEGKKRFDGDVDQAILFADKAIRTTQPSFRPMDLSPIQHSRKGAARAFTMFSTFTLLYGRMQRGLFKAWKQGRITPSEFFRMFTWENIVAPIAMTMFFATLRKEVPPPEEVLADLFSYNLMGIPFVKDLASVASAKFKGKKFAAEWDSPLFTPFDLAAKLTDFIVRLIRDLDNDKTWKNAVLTMAELFSFLIGVPAPRIAKDAIRGMEQWERGEGTPFNVLVPQTPSRR